MKHVLRIGTDDTIFRLGSFRPNGQCHGRLCQEKKWCSSKSSYYEELIRSSFPSRITTQYALNQLKGWLCLMPSFRQTYWINRLYHFIWRCYDFVLKSWSEILVELIGWRNWARGVLVIIVSLFRQMDRTQVKPTHSVCQCASVWDLTTERPGFGYVDVRGGN